jgi:hypothetical protein
VPETIQGVRTMIPRVPTTIQAVPTSAAGPGSFVHGEEIEVGIGADGASPSQEIGNMKAVMIGSGYVGVVLGVCFAEFGAEVAAWISTSARSHASKRARSRSTNRVSRTW